MFIFHLFHKVLTTTSQQNTKAIVLGHRLNSSTQYGQKNMNKDSKILNVYEIENTSRKNIIALKNENTYKINVYIRIQVFTKADCNQKFCIYQYGIHLNDNGIRWFGKPWLTIHASQE